MTQPDFSIPGPGKILIHVNGEPFAFVFGCKLTDLLKTQGMDPARVTVTRNGEVISPFEIRGVVLNEGDRLNIVRISAGA